ncbi:multidrug transporter [Solibacillus sp. A46]|uniref:Multidrug transporter n=1 Tax=Solibacillus faecavium TaxID=2762221 RepID=A0ABR8XXK9_9BACL|nr:multidrug transporter [Solibacillus faecavium]MBD8036692.1 multidrug transporter [Solibacillus faecavium]
MEKNKTSVPHLDTKLYDNEIHLNIKETIAKNKEIIEENREIKEALSYLSSKFADDLKKATE